MSGSVGSWLLYGANGYTGRLIIEEAVRRGLRPILGGRREEAIAPLAEKHGLSYRTFDLSSPKLEGVSALLLAAGPFSATSKPALDACLASKVHYLDITGEIDVFEACFARRDEAVRAGIAVLPGVGFDVVPSDCLAKKLAEALPEAVELELAFSGGVASAGTMKTMLEALPSGGRVRRGGKIEKVPPAWKELRVPFRDRPRDCASIPWGDVSTAWWSTRIPHVTVYAPIPRVAARAIRLAQPLLGLLDVPGVRRVLGPVVDALVPGPSDETRRTARTQLWGRVRAADGRVQTGTLETIELYSLSALTSVEATVRVAEGRLPAGAMTPSKAFGSGFIEEFAGCTFVLD